MSNVRTLLDIISPTVKPVDFSTFVLSEDFCNQKGIYPFWCTEGNNLEDPEELILDGSLGGGKSTFGALYALYRLYKLLLIPNLRKSLGILDISSLDIIYLSTNLNTAKISGFQYLINIFDSCAWFTENHPRNKDITSVVEIPDVGINIRYASKEAHALSLNVIGFILDEANFRSGVGVGNVSEYAEVTHLYQQLIDRQISRFSTPTGSRAFGILISSASYQSSFVERRKELVKSNPKASIITSVTYKVKPWQFSKDTFTVFIGTGTVSPEIVRDQSHKELLIRKLSMDNLESVAEQYFIKVPENLRSQFETNCSLALQNHAGISTQIYGRLFSNMQLIIDSLVEDVKPWFPDYTVTLSNKDDLQLIDLLIKDHIQFPERPHSFFLDASVSGDPSGFTCYRNDSENGIIKHTHIFTLSIVPPPFPAETRLSKILNFMFDISQIVNVAAFASDQYQSKQIRQEIQTSLGLPDTRFSIDSSDEFHLHFMRGLVDKQVTILRYLPIISEFESLIHNLKTRKVVKADGMHDDVTQSIVGAYFLSSCYTDNDSVVDLFELRHNLVGRQAVIRVQKALGYR